MHMDRPVFVFGSNLAGHHGKGAALEALHRRGAILGRSAGLQGNSYAIPTKDEIRHRLPLDKIAEGIDGFLDYTRTHPWLLFDVTPIGCGPAGYKPDDIAPMFQNAPHNVTLPDAFEDVLRTPSA